MAWQPNSFLEKYPEFRQAGEPMLRRAIADAAAQVDPTVYGNLADKAIGLIAAIDLEHSPYSKTQKLVDDGKPTEYEKQLTLLKQMIRVGFIVL